MEHIIGAVPVEAPAEGELYDLLRGTIRAHDPDGIPVPGHGPVRDGCQAPGAARRARSTGSRRCAWTPGSGSSSGSTAVDERVGLEALRWGLPVLFDVVAG